MCLYLVTAAVPLSVYQLQDDIISTGDVQDLIHKLQLDV